MKNLNYLLSLCLILIGCGNPANSAKLETKVQIKKSVLIIGDSISIGYTPWLRKSLVDHDVLHNPGNGYSTALWLLDNIIDQWLGMKKEKWDAVIFNACLHDIWDIPQDIRIRDSLPQRYVRPEDYRTNLIIAAKKVKARTDHPLFVLGTWTPPGAQEGRTLADIQAYNQIAKEVMDDLGIPTVDLYTVSESIPHLYEDADTGTNVHLTPEGSSVLASAIMDQLKTSYDIK